MKVLLDTHTFFWWATEPGKLSDAARDAVEDAGNELILSVVSPWEIQIKAQLGKFTLTRPLRDIIHDQVTVNGLRSLPVTFAHVLALDSLPVIHKDPFDRLLMAQSIAEGATLVSADHVFVGYPIALLW